MAAMDTLMARPACFNKAIETVRNLTGNHSWTITEDELFDCWDNVHSNEDDFMHAMVF